MTQRDDATYQSSRDNRCFCFLPLQENKREKARAEDAEVDFSRAPDKRGSGRVCVKLLPPPQEAIWLNCSDEIVHYRYHRHYHLPCSLYLFFSLRVINDITPGIYFG